MRRVWHTGVVTIYVIAALLWGTARPSAAQQGFDEDDPDLPAFAQSTADKQDYLRRRSAYIGRLRGFEAGKLPDISARIRAIHEMALETALGPVGFALAPLISSTDWTPVGPAPVPNGQTTSVSTPVSGRATVVAVHPTNPNVAYLGTAQGGLFRTLDGGATWTALMDTAQSLAIGAIAIEPVNPSTVFVGTGEPNGSLDSYFGVGLYVIRNADTAPVLTGPFETRTNGGNGHAFIGTAISQIVVDPNNDNNILVGNTLGAGGVSGEVICCGGTNPPSAFIGLYFSSNAQSAAPTFDRVASLPGAGVAAVTDLVIEPGNANTVVVASEDLGGGGTSGIYRSTNALLDAASTWTQTLALSPTRVRLATNKVGSTVTVLAATGETDSSANACKTGGAPTAGVLRRSVDGGATFPTQLTAANGFCGGQCWYDMPVALDPNNASIIYLGGAADGTCSAVMQKSTNGGTSFSRIDTGLHADNHAIMPAPSLSSTVYVGTDGGVWKSTNSGGAWTSLNNSGLNTIQFMSVAVHPTDPFFSIGGSQDNGTEWLQPSSDWTRADFGDGGFSQIDQNATDTTHVTMYHTYYNQTNSLLGFARVITTASAVDGGWSFLGASGSPCASNNGIACSNTVLFYAPMALGPGNPNTLYFGTDRLYRSVDRGGTMVAVSQGPFVANTAVSAIGISPQNDAVRIVGLENGKVFATTTGGNPLIDVTGVVPAAYIARAIIDPNSSNTAYVTLSGYGLAAGAHVWKTTNLNAGAPTWTAAGSGIPDIPVNGFVVDPASSTNLYAGTDIGVYASTDAGVNWNPFGSGLPRVAVFDMAIQNTNRFLRVATHGRGMWEIALAPPGATPTATPINTATLPPSATPTSTSTPTRTMTPLPTASNTPTNTGTQTATATRTPTPSPTFSATHTSTATDTPTSTPSSTATNTATQSPTRTPTSTLTATRTPTFTPTSTVVPTSTPTATLTPPPTSSPTATPTNTPTASLTPTFTATHTATQSPTPTSTLAATGTPTSTSTSIAVPTSTPTPTLTASPASSATSTPTDTPTASETPTVTSTLIAILSPTPSATPTTAAGASPTPTAPSTPTTTVVEAQLLGSVTLQGRPLPPDPRWSVPLRVSLTPQAGGTALMCTPTTDQSGNFVCDGLPPTMYTVCVKHSHTLQNCKSVLLTVGPNPTDFGTLREGDANDDNCVALVDFSILGSAFGKCIGNVGFDQRADLDENGCVVLTDFSLLVTNFGQCGD